MRPCCAPDSAARTTPGRSSTAPCRSGRQAADQLCRPAQRQLEGAVVLGQRIFYVGGDISVACWGGHDCSAQYRPARLHRRRPGLAGHPADSGRFPAAARQSDEGAYAVWSSQVRYVGVGAMVVGGIAAIAQVRHGLVEALRVLFGTGGLARSQTAQPEAASDATFPLAPSSFLVWYASG